MVGPGGLWDGSGSLQKPRPMALGLPVGLRSPRGQGQQIIKPMIVAGHLNSPSLSDTFYILSYGSRPENGHETAL